MPCRVRFAPSPTGHLHVGNVRTAIFNWLFVRKTGGDFILRIEDTDLARSEQRFEDLIYEDLRWLGMEWQEGPDKGGKLGPYRQSDRLQIYQGKARQLVTEGKAYYCFCSEEELAQQAEQAKQAGITWKYPGTCLKLSPSEISERLEGKQPAVIRLKTRPGEIRFHDLVHGSMEFSSEVISDLILIRSNGLPTYNYAVVVDDALMEITHAIRGDDHLSNTPKQVLIYEAFGWALPEFAHLSTILGSDHTRLSKRHGATSIKHLMDMGILPEALVNYLALLGWSPAEGQSEILPIEELIQSFDLAHVSKSPAVFDLTKLYWINRHYLAASNPARIVELAVPYLRTAGLIGELDPPLKTWVTRLTEAFLGGVDHLSQLPEKVSLVFNFNPSKALEEPSVKEVVSAEGSLQVIQALHNELQQHEGRVVETWKEVVSKVKSKSGKKGKQLFHPIRVALTGSESGPELDKLVPLIEEGSRLPLPSPILNCQERAQKFMSAVNSES
ncbi:MAG: glutamate--tRNA ligase [Terriglobia bacterium]